MLPTHHHDLRREGEAPLPITQSSSLNMQDFHPSSESASRRRCCLLKRTTLLSGDQGHAIDPEVLLARPFERTAWPTRASPVLRPR